MVIRMTGAYNLEVLDDFEDFTRGIDVVQQQILNEVRDEIEPELLAELKKPVGAVKYPIEWTSDKQRRAFFATNGFGKGIPYRRTGKLQAAWVVEVRGNAIVVENKSAIAKYVVGSLAQNRSAALRFQQRFHANTGWQPATDTVKTHLDKANEIYVAKFDEWLKDLASSKPKRRAFTKGTRRR